MEQNSPFKNISDKEQVKKYAEDLSRLYQSEKKKLVELEAANRQLKKFGADLNQTFQELKTANEAIQNAYLDTIHRLVLAAEYKDEDTGDHIVRMSRYSCLIAEKSGLSSKDVDHILFASPMHDIGKIGIPDSILLKTGKLTKEEFDFMKTHTTIGAKILANSKAEILQVSQQIAASHHEKWDGTGYPQGLKGNNIPIFGRIVAISDVFDALTSRRPYKDPYPVDVAVSIIEKESGHHFDPELVDVFVENLGSILKIKEDVGSAEDISVSTFIYSERDQVEVP